MIWFTSDHHFGHTNIIKYCSRPFNTVEEMNWVMVENWNTLVQPDDLVYYLGDFSLKLSHDEVAILLAKLHGTKILIRGNHDDRAWGSKQWRSAGFSDVHKRLNIQLGEYSITLSHYPKGPQDLRTEWRLCGHVHQAWGIKNRTLNVGVDMHCFCPINEHTVKGLFGTHVL